MGSARPTSAAQPPLSSPIHSLDQKYQELMTDPTREPFTLGADLLHLVRYQERVQAAYRTLQDWRAWLVS